MRLIDTIFQPLGPLDYTELVELVNGFGVFRWGSTPAARCIYETAYSVASHRGHGNTEHGGKGGMDQLPVVSV
jgi:hypothetical protein